MNRAIPVSGCPPVLEAHRLWPGLTWVRGANFSGRSALLRRLTGPGNQGVFIPPELEVSLSGLRLTVSDETRLHAGPAADSAITNELFQLTGLSEHLGQNPTTLSGGELALVILGCKIALGRRVLAVDCALEQVAPNLKCDVLNLLKARLPETSSLVLVDNRQAEVAFDFDHIWTMPAEQSSKVTELQIRSDIEFARPFRAPTLALQDITFGYVRERTVIKAASLQLTPGQVYLLVGVNGSGKSTMAKILTGVLRPTAGQITVDGRETSPYRSPGNLVSYVYQDPDVQFVDASVAEDAALGVRDEPRRPAATRIEAALRALGLATLKSTEIASLPYVLRKRASLVGVLAALKPWLIIDEPSLGQDEASVVAITEIFKRLAALGYGIIVISHSTLVRRLLTPTIISIKDGAVTVTPP